MTAPAALEKGKEKRGLARELKRGSVGAMGVRVVSMLLLLALSVLLARFLGAEGFGVYSFALGVIGLLGLPANAGLPTLVIREVAVFTAGGKTGHLRGLLTRVNQAVLGISIGLAALTAALVIALGPDNEISKTLAISLFLLPILALGKLRGAALTGLSRVVQGQLPELVVTPAMLAILVVGYAIIIGETTPTIAMSLHVLAALLAFAVGTWLLLRQLPPEVKRASPVFEDRRWLTSAAPLSIMAGSSVVNGHADIVMLGVFAEPEEVGIYRVATQVAAVVPFGITAINAVISPHISRLHAEGGRARLQTLVTAAARGSLAVTGLVLVGLVVFGSPALRFAFGDDFVRSYLPMVILGTGHLVVVSLGSLVTIASMTGKERGTAKIMLIGIIPNVVLNLVLIPLLGGVGAAIGTTISLIIWRLVLFHHVRTTLLLDTSIVGKRPLPKDVGAHEKAR